MHKRIFNSLYEISVLGDESGVDTDQLASLEGYTLLFKRVYEIEKQYVYRFFFKTV